MSGFFIMYTDIYQKGFMLISSIEDRANQMSIIILKSVFTKIELNRVMTSSTY